MDVITSVRVPATPERAPLRVVPLAMLAGAVSGMAYGIGLRVWMRFIGWSASTNAPASDTAGEEVSGVRSLASVSSVPSTRVRMTVAYRGDRFRGWAENEGIRSVEATLRDALATVVRAPVALDVAGRTDAGVHADAQVVSTSLPAGADLDDIGHRVNAIAGPDISVLDIEAVEDGFHARFSAIARRYRYRVLTRDPPDPFRRDVTWHRPGRLDVATMNTAATSLVGEHDFTSFCRRPKLPPDASLVRRVEEATWSETSSDEAVFEVEANAFCHQMVRSVVGLLVAVGAGRFPPGHVGSVLEARDRAAARTDLAPPAGLSLVAVRYE